MRREMLTHYMERDEDREVHIIPDCDVFDVYYVKGKDCSLSYMFGLPNYQPCEDKHYGIDDIFQIAWNYFTVYEEMSDDE